MNKLTNNEKKIIDKYFDENPNNDILLDDNADLLEEKLQYAMSKMDILKEDNIDIPSNFFNIINKAEEATQKQAFYKEFISFILISALLLSLFGTLIVIFGPKLFIIFETVMFVALPLSLIPISRNIARRGDL